MSGFPELKDRLDADPDFFIPVDDSWVYDYDPETKVFNRKRVAFLGLTEGTSIKVKLQGHEYSLFDSKDIVRLEFAPRGTTVNSESYKGDIRMYIEQTMQNLKGLPLQNINHK